MRPKGMGKGIPVPHLRGRLSEHFRRSDPPGDNPGGFFDREDYLSNEKNNTQNGDTAGPGC